MDRWIVDDVAQASHLWVLWLIIRMRWDHELPHTQPRSGLMDRVFKEFAIARTIGKYGWQLRGIISRKTRFVHIK